MTPSNEQALIPAIRAAVIERVERTSLRDVARQVGMTPSGLAKFMNGSEPYRKTIRKLEGWYVRWRARSEDERLPSPETVAAAIRILAVFLPPASRGPFVDELLARLGGAFPPDPSWRAELGNLSAYMRAADTGAFES